MPLYLSLKKMGGGKTLICVIMALIYLYQNPDKYVYSNVKINHSRAKWTKYGFVPINRLNDAMIIWDDMEDLGWLKGLMSIITNISRKKSLYIYCTGQDYTQFSPKMRSLCDYVIDPSYSKLSKFLFFDLVFINRNGRILGKLKGNYIKRANDFFKYYDTYQVVKKPYDFQIEKEILKHSNNLEELLDNIYLWRGKNRKQFSDSLKKLSKIKKFDISHIIDNEETIDYDYKSLIYLYLNKIKNMNQTKIASHDGITQPAVSEKIRRLEYELENATIDYM